VELEVAQQLGAALRRDLARASAWVVVPVQEHAGAERVLSSSVAPDGDALSFSVELSDATKRVLFRATWRVAAGAVDETLPRLVAELRAREPAFEDSGVGARVEAAPLKPSLALSVRVEGDVWGTMGVAPAVQAALRYGPVGVALTGIVVPWFGARVEARVLPLPRGRLNPWLAAGATFFMKPRYVGTGGPLLYARAALGLAVAFGHFELLADAAAEYALVARLAYSEVALVVSGGVGWHF
jgi:hypothetical protein